MVFTFRNFEGIKTLCQRKAFWKRTILESEKRNCWGRYPYADAFMHAIYQNKEWKTHNKTEAEPVQPVQMNINQSNA